jgi:drug/metabolite transporter (DMT)-like permease
LTWAGFGLVLLTAVLMAVANLFIKHGIVQAGGFVLSVAGLLHLLRQPILLAGCSLTGIAAVLWFRILATQKLSTCYPLFVSLTYSLITIGAVYFLHERMSVQKVLGLAVIVAGIAAVARG